MGLQKRTYALPPDVVERFENAVSAGNRSSVVAGILKAWIEEQERARLRSAVIEGCRDMADVYLEIEREYHPLEEEVERSSADH